MTIRKKEFEEICNTKYLDAFCVFFWACTSLSISTVTFISYEILYGTLENFNIFSAIYLFNLLVLPLNALPWTIGGLLTGRVSFYRIDDFIKIPEI